MRHHYGYEYIDYTVELFARGRLPCDHADQDAPALVIGSVPLAKTVSLCPAAIETRELGAVSGVSFIPNGRG